MSNSKIVELEIIYDTDNLERIAEAAKKLAEKCDLLELCIAQIQDQELKRGLRQLGLELKTKSIAQEQNLADLEQGNEVLDLMLSNNKINPPQVEPRSLPNHVPDLDDDSESESEEEIESNFKSKLKVLIKKLESKGPTWGKVLGAVLIIAGVLLGLASFATMIPSFSTSVAAVPVAVTWVLSGCAFFSTSIGAAAEYLSADEATNISTAVETVLKAC